MYRYIVIATQNIELEAVHSDSLICYSRFPNCSANRMKKNSPIRPLDIS